MEYTQLKNLTGKHDSGPIRVRVCRMWDAINSRRKDLLSLDMVVADEEGSFMWGQIRRSMVARFRQQLVVGSVYVITNYSVAAVTGEYRPVDSLYKLSFTLITAIRRVYEPIPSIPVHAFCFVAPSTIMARINDNTFLTGATEVYVNPDHSHAASLAARYNDKLPTITLNVNPLSLSESIEAALFHNRMTVTQILRAEWRQEKTDYGKHALMNDIDITLDDTNLQVDQYVAIYVRGYAGWNEACLTSS